MQGDVDELGLSWLNRQVHRVFGGRQLSTVLALRTWIGRQAVSCLAVVDGPPSEGRQTVSEEACPGKDWARTRAWEDDSPLSGDVSTLSSQTCLVVSIYYILFLYSYSIDMPPKRSVASNARLVAIRDRQAEPSRGPDNPGVELRQFILTEEESAELEREFPPEVSANGHCSWEEKTPSPRRLPEPSRFHLQSSPSSSSPSPPPSPPPPWPPRPVPRRQRRRRRRRRWRPRPRRRRERRPRPPKPRRSPGEEAGQNGPRGHEASIRKGHDHELLQEAGLRPKARRGRPLWAICKSLLFCIYVVH